MIKKQDGGSDTAMEHYQESFPTKNQLTTITNNVLYVNHKGLTLYDLDDETTRRLIVYTTTLTLKDLTPSKPGTPLPRYVHEVILSSKILKSQIEFHGTFTSGEIVLFVERSSKCFTEVTAPPDKISKCFDEVRNDPVPGPRMSAKQFYDSLK